MENQSLFKKTSKEPVKLETVKGPVDETNRIPCGYGERGAEKK